MPVSFGSTEKNPAPHTFFWKNRHLFVDNNFSPAANSKFKKNIRGMLLFRILNFEISKLSNVFSKKISFQKPFCGSKISDIF